MLTQDIVFFWISKMMETAWNAWGVALRSEMVHSYIGHVWFLLRSLLSHGDWIYLGLLEDDCIQCHEHHAVIVNLEFQTQVQVSVYAKDDLPFMATSNISHS